MNNHFIFSFIFFQFLSWSHGTPLAPALYVFGDSLFDSGNNNLLPTTAKADFRPYGFNFVSGPTGRFTNGRTVPDFIAEFLGLPYSPPYLNIRSAITLTGLNYASGSCGILPETGSPHGKCLTLKDQIDLFTRTVKVELPRHFKSASELKEYLSRSIFIFCIGSNDYINNYLETKLFSISKQYPPPQFAQLLVHLLAHQFERLYRLGGRKIIMFEIGPIGCIPSVKRDNKHDGQCIEDANKVVSHFNHRLAPMLSNLTSTLQGSNFVLGHAYWLGYDAIINPSKYGLRDSSNPCCTAWFNGTSSCIPWLVPCPNPQKHYFWDAYHLTESVCDIIVTRCINDTSVCSPINIQQLVQV